MSRTNRKQQLMREHTKQLEEKEKKIILLTSAQSTSAINVPRHTSTVIPRQFLKFQSKLSNPTDYHVEHSQKRQVQEFLSQSHCSGNNVDLQGAVIDIINSSNSNTTPVLNSSTSDNVDVEQLWNDIEAIYPVGDSVDDSGVDHSFPQCVATISEKNMNLLTMFATENVPTFPEDCESYSEKSPVLNKVKSKKKLHNEVERRRRGKINTHIMELKDQLPKSTDLFYEKVKNRQYKGAILQDTVAYLKQLKEETKKVPQLESEVKMQKTLIQKFLALIQIYESTLQSHNIPVPHSIWHPSSESDIEALIKQEPNYMNEIACVSSAPHGSTVSATQFNIKPLEKFAHSLDQVSRPGRPTLQFLTAQQNVQSNSIPNKVTKSSQDSFYSSFNPTTNFDLVENDYIITDDVMLQSRDSSTSEDMDMLP